MQNGGKSNKDEKAGAIYQFFKDLTDGKYKVGKQEIPFQLFITRFRREKRLDSMQQNLGSRRQVEGEKVMNAYKNQIAQAKMRERIQKGQNLDGQDIEGLKNEIESYIPNEPPEVLLDILGPKDEDEE